MPTMGHTGVKEGFIIMRRAMMMASAVAALSVSMTGCCKCEMVGNYAIGAYSESMIYGGGLSWNGRTSYFGDEGPAFVIVAVPQGTTPAVALIEVYRGSERLDIPETIQRGVIREDCVADEITYDVLGLADGEYLVVHRLSSAPDGLLLAEGHRDDVTSFEGEPALVTTLVVETPTGPARPGDAGP